MLSKSRERITADYEFAPNRNLLCAKIIPENVSVTGNG